MSDVKAPEQDWIVDLLPNVTTTDTFANVAGKTLDDLEEEAENRRRATMIREFYKPDQDCFDRRHRNLDW